MAKQVPWLAPFLHAGEGQRCFEMGRLFSQEFQRTGGAVYFLLISLSFQMRSFAGFDVAM